MGFADKRECPTLCKLASEYIRKLDGCEEEIYNFFAGEPEADSLFIKLVEEIERCILSYFAFHWSQASHTIGQVKDFPPIYPTLSLTQIHSQEMSFSFFMFLQILSAESEPKKKLKHIFMAATRYRDFYNLVSFFFPSLFLSLSSRN